MNKSNFYLLGTFKFKSEENTHFGHHTIAVVRNNVYGPYNMTDLTIPNLYGLVRERLYIILRWIINVKSKHELGVVNPVA